ncbi:VanW family protein [Patescibacteria group bacterium]|nr:VanW family protein [Patescibacteria group bacterium]MBU1662994.1 VanW family protein [Patescibacteria group bacterium]MBU1934182.1 VanW family protein [Patescibacteria group bacterium]MBU2008169.1 VanW family protein [Patescibacteria group bacterium]MBU2233648.1 VanW family protein [Patescibacteria group bacterium]
MTAIIFFILLILALSGLFIFDKVYQNKIYPNIFIGALNLSGQTAEQAKKFINIEINKIDQAGVVFSYKETRATIAPVIASTDGDLAIQIINFNTDMAIEAAFNYGRQDNFFINLEKKLSLLINKKQLCIETFVNQGQAKKILEDAFAKTFQPAEDAKLVVKKTVTPGAYEFTVANEKFGKIIDYEEAIRQMLNNLSNIDSKEIKLSTITEYPKILAKDSLNIESKAKAILAIAPLTLIYGDKKWIIEEDQLANLLTLKLNNLTTNKVDVGLDKIKTSVYLQEKIVSEIDQKPIEAKFEISNGKVSKFQNGQDGLTLNIEATITKMETEIITSNPIELVVETRPTLINDSNINNFGIKEIIGVGTSSFAGSPANRRHNITIGANAINGTLIKPGEEFSLLKTLGEIASSTGYLPELIIKQGKTMPEYGGGLCQIGTTMFRGVINSGLPVTLRRNHSYRVAYYEPAGTDATIYDPWPDFRFINDTPTYILIQQKISGDIISFEFWGARDGRAVTSTKPVIYNIIKPEPTKIIETTELKPGVKKCTERAHNGADAHFDYKVIYPDGQIKEKRFFSHYVPWQEVCLLGVAKLSAPLDTATSTLPTAAN